MANRPGKLQNYGQKRDFRKSPEPSSDEDRLDWADQRPVFVIQKHDASNLHYDFRLEVDGVLKSWAVPKGPSTDPAEKRLAIPTEDHPLSYGDFEGVIPEDAYGGGTVLVWDRGSYRHLVDEDDDGEESVAGALDDGHLNIWLNGEKLSGGYALIRTGSDSDARWLLVKMDDEEADARRKPTSTEPKSVKTGRTLEEIQSAEKE